VPDVAKRRSKSNHNSSWTKGLTGQSQSTSNGLFVILITHLISLMPYTLTELEPHSTDGNQIAIVNVTIDRIIADMDKRTQ
jgi:hypothetical protein